MNRMMTMTIIQRFKNLNAKNIKAIPKSIFSFLHLNWNRFSCLSHSNAAAVVIYQIALTLIAGYQLKDWRTWCVRKKYIKLTEISGLRKVVENHATKEVTYFELHKKSKPFGRRGGAYIFSGAHTSTLEPKQCAETLRQTQGFFSL